MRARNPIATKIHSVLDPGSMTNEEMTNEEKIVVHTKIREIVTGLDQIHDVIQICSQDETCSQDITQIVKQWCSLAERIKSFDRGLDQRPNSSISTQRLAYLLATHGHDRAMTLITTLKTVLKEEDLNFLIQTERKILGSLQARPLYAFESEYDLVSKQDLDNMEEAVKIKLANLKKKPLKYMEICIVQSWHKIKEMKKWKENVLIWNEVKSFYEGLMVEKEVKEVDKVEGRFKRMENYAINNTPSYGICMSPYHDLMHHIRNLLLKKNSMKYDDSELFYRNLKQIVEKLPTTSRNAKAAATNPNAGKHASTSVGTEIYQNVEAVAQHHNPNPVEDESTVGNENDQNVEAAAQHHNPNPVEDESTVGNENDQIAGVSVEKPIAVATANVDEVATADTAIAPANGGVLSQAEEDALVAVADAIAPGRSVNDAIAAAGPSVSDMEEFLTIDANDLRDGDVTTFPQAPASNFFEGLPDFNRSNDNPVV